MIQLRSTLNVADNSGAKRLRTIFIFGGWKLKWGFIGDVVIASVIHADPQSQIKKGDKVKAVIVRTRAATRRSDGSSIRFDDNAAVILEDVAAKTPKGTRIFGPVAREVKEAGFAKIASLAQEVL